MSLTDVNHDAYWQEYFNEMEDDFLRSIERTEEGEISHLDLAVKFAKESEILEKANKMRKDWQNENLESILNEAEKYGKSGFKGYLFSNSSRVNYKYDTNPRWIQLKDEMDEIATQMKMAYVATGKNLINATFDGEEIILPKVEYTKPTLKILKIK